MIYVVYFAICENLIYFLLNYKRDYLLIGTFISFYRSKWFSSDSKFKKNLIKNKSDLYPIMCMQIIKGFLFVSALRKMP